MPHHLRALLRPLPRRPRAARPGCEVLEGRALLTAYTALDPTFGVRGKVFGAPDAGTGAALSIGSAVARQADGKVVEVGTYANSQQYATALGQLAVRRFNEDGSPDTTFGTGGQVTIPLPATTTSVYKAPQNVVINPDDGSISFAASANLPESSSIHPRTEGFVARVTATGALDPTFGTGGQYVFTGSFTGASSVALQDSGRLLVLDSDNSNFANLFLTRLTRAGTLDPTFNLTEPLKIPNDLPNPGFGAFSDYRPAAMVVSPTTGQIYVAGNVYLTMRFGSPNLQGSVLTRVNPSGTLDTSYGSGGSIVLRAVVNGLAIQSDDKLVAVGEIPLSYDRGIGFLGRYTTAGALDPTFAANTNPQSLTSSLPGFTSVAVGAGDTITVAGDLPSEGLIESGTVTRYRVGGTLDPTFGHNGVVTITQRVPAGTSNQAAGVAINSIALDPRGQVILAGGVTVGTNDSDATHYNLLGRILPVATTTLVGDYDGDGVSDLAAYLPGLAGYAFRPSSGPADSFTSFGKPGAGVSIPMPGDYDGDGLTDLGVYLPEVGLLIYRPSTNVSGNDRVVNFQVGSGDLASIVPAAGDYDGDGKTDPVVYDQATGEFLLATSVNNQGTYTSTAIPYGIPGLGASIPAPGDYDGDGKTDLAVYIPSLGEFAYQSSAGGGDVFTPFGLPGARMTIPAPGDYDGDGKTDIAAYLPTLGLYAYRPSAGLAGGPDVLQSFGLAGDGASIPAPGDYDGDGKYDIAVYLPQLAIYAYRPSSSVVAGADVLASFGAPGTGVTIPTASIPYAQPSTVSGMSLAASPESGVPVALTDDVLELLAGTTGRKKKA